ncbi:DUF3306 domain-containing protein [Azospirillum lipoferum]|uniref:DUF3306 domain-containing protein n=1 Tax=Azospirillum lipoferum (strain 4B) TaxID=862719 RepID=G7ZH75_AZOL4|nr:DUF3306 domain-containing protein [Azospirillum lipoferum]CBS90783.1 protein of unknown function [Azospirillum lipoferum 4B]
MADPAGTEGFLGRWSRLKRETQTEEAPVEIAVPERMDDAPAAVSAEVGAEVGAEIAPAPPAEEEAPDLPSLDSLNAGSDYTGFLRKEVPEELRRQALRKAWASDPAIAGFRGFAEYDWDYNAPGYGALRPTDDIARLLDAVLPDEKREEEVVVEEVVAEGDSADGDLPVDSTCPHPNPPPLGGGGSECSCERVAAVPPPPSGGG